MKPFPTRLLAIVLLLLALLHPAAMASETVELRLPNMPPPESTNIIHLSQRAVINRFKQLHPHVRVTGFQGLMVEGMGMESGPLLALAGGTAPDLLYLEFRSVDTYLRQGFIQPLDRLVERDWRAGELQARVPKPAWPVIRRAGLDGREHLWALPTELFVQAMAYERNTLRRAGLDPEGPPRSWPEMLRIGRQVFDPPRQFGVGLLGGSYQSKGFLPFLLGAGSRVMEADEQGEWRAAFDDEGAVEALYFYWQLVRQPYTKDGVTYKGCSNLSIPTPAKATSANAIRFYALGSVILFTEDPEGLPLAPLPPGPGGAYRVPVNCSMLALNGTLDWQDPGDRAKIEAAWEYLKFVTSPEAAKVRVQTLVEMGYGEYVNPLLLEQFGYRRELAQVPSHYRELFRQAVAHGEPEPYGKNTDLIYLELNRPISVVMTHDYRGWSEERIKAHIRSVLRAATARTNQKILGQLPPPVRQQRRALTGVVMPVVFTLFAGFLVVLLRQYRLDVPAAGRRRSVLVLLGRYWPAYLMLVPALGSIALWQYWPLLRGSLMAFQEYSLVRRSELVGLANFSEVLFSAEFWHSMLRSGWYAALTLALTFPGPILLAVLLQEVPRGKILFRVLFYLPSLTSGLVIMFLWKGFYDPSPNGILNRALGLTGLGPFEWLADPRLAMLCVIMPSVWAGLGGGSLVYLAALKSIPDDLYEAATLDGAGFLAKLRHIVFPSLKALIIINFVGAFIGAFKASENILAMSGAGPNDSTMVAGLQIFYQAFFYLKFGVATAMAWIMGSLLIGFTVFQLRILSRMQFSSAAVKEAA